MNNALMRSAMDVANADEALRAVHRHESELAPASQLPISEKFETFMLILILLVMGTVGWMALS